MRLFIIFLLLCCTQISFGQIDSATITKWYNQNLSSYVPITNTLNDVNGIQLCDCKKDSSNIYLYKFWSMPLLTDSAGTFYVSHQIFVFEKPKINPKITVYENFKSRVTSPKSNWNAFNQTLDSINVKTLPRIFFELRYTVIGSPDGSMYMLRICENGSPKILILADNLEMVTQTGMDRNAFRQSGQKIARIQRLFQLFMSELR